MDAKEISRLRRLVKKARKASSGKRVRYPQSVKRLVLEVLGAGVSAVEISQSTGLSTSTVFGWSQKQDKASFRRVKVSALKRAATEIPSLKVLLPNGICLEGASVPVLREIIGWFK